MGGEVKGKLANGVGSQYSPTTSERGVSSITNADAHTSGAKGAVCGLRSAQFAGECALSKPEDYHLFLPSPMHACPRHGSRATSFDS
jgi:hypothetical protein